MEIQTLKPGEILFNPRFLQDHSGNSADATTTFSQQLALSANEAWEKPSSSAPGDLTNFQILAESPSTMPPLSMKQLDLLVPIIATKGWNVRSLAFLRQAEDNTEIRPPDL
jgi:hypothetical protein